MKSLRRSLSLVLRLALVCLAMALAYLLSTMLVPPIEMDLTPAEMRWSGVALFLVSALNALALAYPVLRSHWHGLKLAAALCLLLFGVETFLTHIETLYFNAALQLQDQELLGLVASGALRALLFAPLAVWLLGKWRPAPVQPALQSPPRFWLRLAALAPVYVLVYFLFGYFVAWQWPETRLFYTGSTAILPFWQHFRGLFTAEPWFIPFQLLRGLLWGGSALLIARMLGQARRWEAALAAALVFGVLMSSGIGLFPNPFMPPVVRQSHFYELLSSMLLYGALSGWVMHPPVGLHSPAQRSGASRRPFWSWLRRRGVPSTLGVLLLLALCAGCAQPAQTATPVAGLPNPASVYCEGQGYRVEIRTGADGSQSGVCVFRDGGECDEWAYYRGECAPAPATLPPTVPAEAELAADGCKVYRDAALGYSFHYPAEAQIQQNDEPLGSFSVIGPPQDGENWPFFQVSHPADRAEFRPPQGIDLGQWLADHYLLGDERLPDVQIAGETAVHLRHARSPQSYASDRYYFAHDGQLFMIVIGHSDDREDWELYNHFLQSFAFA